MADKADLSSRSSQIFGSRVAFALGSFSLSSARSRVLSHFADDGMSTRR
jgi:hypothetical protein